VLPLPFSPGPPTRCGAGNLAVHRTVPLRLPRSPARAHRGAGLLRAIRARAADELDHSHHLFAPLRHFPAGQDSLPPCDFLHIFDPSNSYTARHALCCPSPRALRDRAGAGRPARRRVRVSTQRLLQALTPFRL
jgi:hypothetical protein